ncbi:DUF4350 domain-containing protein [Flavobacterium sp. NKUCC04_CG]|uniref:DUF4350 domain-containing protein n=1 Tax=Flavobacterium sp. NKUCC04_CG TaxID=2842121 RepID=UPI001C5B4C37|nr:DUF4350 domain-containing protein [Flavobacterium sp. NKUCC04_CG]MBW3517991.1 DUF4350 domain-containing protein [Flavobacterium sp. NKUCC04_CG]
MNRTFKKYLLFFILAIALILFVDYNKPKPINWAPTFLIEDKIPFGLFILNHEMDSLLKDRQLQRFSQGVYEFITDSLSKDTTALKTVLLIDNYSSIHYPDTPVVLDFVAQGNTVFAIGPNLPQSLTDTLNLMEYTYEQSDKTVVWTTNQNLSRQKFNLDKAYSQSYFSSIDTVNTSILGYQHSTQFPDAANFIKVPFGKGFFYFNTQSKAFTNYSLLESNNHLYVENILSYLPKQTTYWKVNKKTNQEDELISSSPLRFILSNPALKWAWYFILLGLLTFALFTAKRKQRQIPIIRPLTNTTVEFTKSIASLYLMAEDYSDLADKIILYALTKIRQTYLLDTHNLNETFIAGLQKMTSKDPDAIRTWVASIKSHQANPGATTQQSAIDLHRLTEEILN